MSKKIKKNKKIEVIDLFSGVGGLTYGLRKSGLSVLAGLDNDESCAKHKAKTSLSVSLSLGGKTGRFPAIQNLICAGQEKK